MESGIHSLPHLAMTPAIEGNDAPHPYTLHWYALSSTAFTLVYSCYVLNIAGISCTLLATSRAKQVTPRYLSVYTDPPQPSQVFERPLAFACRIYDLPIIIGLTASVHFGFIVILEQIMIFILRVLRLEQDFNLDAVSGLDIRVAHGDEHREEKNVECLVGVSTLDTHTCSLALIQ
ncbi:uncharacterized protein MYCFIDRAFT_177061 [Pseudocercospora fijiensis CIRAD86]|uniref:Uncharacterized protein n=1 Tax=Pseudocercospora fijiensis (strain CIRAD86) TaxID=383855 RepID=M3ASE3_PSEFD|nr:uncharacterized protein MYCFIDRAFT_177061 [Pseudocercospora fijiensis CIRAD86]EME80078.1 hypothetical protein MYCFIDRAFT_177061 [Pseudocercospora fijiensis CIRAD86]